MRPKTEMLNELKKMLRNVFTARLAGASHPKMSRDQGFVDGYMRSMLETGMVTQKELLALVGEQRRVVAGPATQEMRPAQVSLASA